MFNKYYRQITLKMHKRTRGGSAARVNKAALAVIRFPRMSFSSHLGGLDHGLQEADQSA